MSLLRRLDDAVCALATGHSRRDLDRVRKRRLQILGGRMIVRRFERAERHDLFRDFLLADAESAMHLVRDIANGGHRLHGAALLQQLEVDRSLLRSARMRGWAQVDAVQRADEDAIEFLKTAPVFSDECYGKLHEGLLHRGVANRLQHHKRVCVRYWHELLHLFLRFRREACGPP
jgi:hypothetical protein